MDIPVIAGTISTVVFAASNLPMLRKALRTRDVSSYSLASLAMINAANVVYSLYVFTLPIGPIWALHTFYVASSAVMLVLLLGQRARRGPGVGSSFMDNRAERLLADQRRDAQDRLEQLDAEMAQLRVDRSGEGADDEHDPDGVTLSAEWSRVEGLRTDAARELADVDVALERAADGSYGVCADCGSDIPAARLDVRPAAARCVACEERATDHRFGGS